MVKPLNSTKKPLLFESHKITLLA